MSSTYKSIPAVYVYLIEFRRSIEDEIIPKGTLLMKLFEKVTINILSFILNFVRPKNRKNRERERELYKIFPFLWCSKCH